LFIFLFFFFEVPAMRAQFPAALVLLLGVALTGCTSSSGPDPAEPSDPDDETEISLEVKLPITGPHQVVLAVPGMT
jgi:hypothetical protein